MTDRYADVEFEGGGRPWRISVGDGDTDESVRRHCAGVWPALRVARVTFGTDPGVPEVDRLRAELAAVTAELDQLIAAWPTGSAASPWRDHEGRWWVDVPRSGPHPSRAAAVRAAAGLGAEGTPRLDPATGGG